MFNLTRFLCIIQSRTGIQCSSLQSQYVSLEHFASWGPRHDSGESISFSLGLVTLTQYTFPLAYLGFPDSSVGNESACMQRSPFDSWVRKSHRGRDRLPTPVFLGSAGKESTCNAGGKGKPTHSSILAWRIPWTIYSTRSQRVGHDWVTFTFTFSLTQFSVPPYPTFSYSTPPPSQTLNNSLLAHKQFLHL